MARRETDPGPDLVGAVAADKRTALEAIRDRLAAELVRSKGQSAAAVAKELRATIDAIEALPGGEESALDELTRRRAVRRAAAQGS